MNIGQGIKELRKRSNIRQIELAKSIGITQSYLSGIENGNKKPSIDLLEVIAKEFQTPLPILFWFSIEEKDVAERKRYAFSVLKPIINELISTI